jgi:hypothetical protein
MCTLVFCLATTKVAALELTYAGVVGNSGEAGMGLVLSPIGKSGGGVALDAQERIFCSGGDRILVLNRDGRRLWEYRLPKPGWVLGGEGFAVVDGSLFFLAGEPLPLAGHNAGKRGDSREVVPNLCRVKMLPEQEAEVLIPAEKLPWKSGLLTLASRGQELFLGGPLPASGYTVNRVSPEGTLSPLFSVKNAGFFSVDERGDFYLGSGEQVVKVDAAGNPVADFRQAVPPKLGATPTSLRGQVLLTQGAIWDGGAYGYLARMDRQYRGYPGFVTSRELPLDHFTQVVDLPGRPDHYYLMSSDALYEAGMREGKLQLLRRFGALPDATALVLTRQGYVGVGNLGIGMMWFNFDSRDAAATPLKVDWVPLGQGWYDGGNAMFFYRNWNNKVLLCRYRAEPLLDLESFEYPQTDGEIHPMASTRVGSHIFAIEKDGETRPLILSGETPLTEGKSRPQALLRAAANKMTSFVTAGLVSDWLPGPADSLASISDKALLVSGTGRIVALKPDPQGKLTRLWELSSPPGSPFGDELHVASSGRLLLVADSMRHRLLLYKFEEDVSAAPSFEAQYGHTDKPDNQVDSLNHPTLVSIDGARAVAFDSANQRVVKLLIK